MSASRGTSPTAQTVTGTTAHSVRCETAFAALDEIVQAPGEHGVVTVVLGAESIAALGRHIGRRASLVGREAVLAGMTGRSESWRELARRVDAFRTTEPIALARRVATVAAGKIVVVGERERTSWGVAVAEELGRLALDPALRLLVVVLHGTMSAAHGGPLPVPEQPTHVALPESGSGPRQLVVELERLSGDDTRRWWEATIAVGDLPNATPLERLDTLDTWWQTARSLPANHAGGTPALSASAAALWSHAVRAEEPLTTEQLEGLGTAAAREELESLGLLRHEARGLWHAAGSAPDLASPCAEADMRLADTLIDADLVAPDRPDAWSTMRAAELYASAGVLERAEQLALRAVGEVADANARDDLWRRWSAVVASAATDTTEPAVVVDRLARSAARALELSDGERADSFARQAMGLGGDRFDVLLLRGRSSTARADLTTATLVLERAFALASDPAQRAQATVALAEVDYHGGRHDDAERRATAAAAGATDVATRLDARNTLGKLLLGRAKWPAAEVHFAEDSVEAAQSNDIERELRARLNRAIAVLSLGRRDDARTMFSDVMAEGEARGSMRAVAFALSNLAAMAITDLAYERALALSERAIDVRHRLGERTGLVRPITNLAELRLRLGLVDEAEQALRFGLQACGRKLPASLLAYFALVSARIELVRGDTNAARRQLGRARAGAAGSGDGGMVGECERLAVRVALEDGDVQRAQAALTVARERTPDAASHVELGLLEAACRRAAGEPFEPQARRALQLAEQRGDAELAREAHVMLCHANRLAEDEDAAQRHLAAALVERDRVARSLPAGLQSRYLARPDLVELAELEAERAPRRNPSRATPEELCPAVPLTAPTSRVMIGDCPPMRALRSAIERIAPTETTVLIRGETGTGKELVAEAIHGLSRRRRGPLVKVNCAALVETLLLSELFGHERGAFTGASARRRGRFELADGGTLFLDEIGDISPRTQVALLRVLQDGTFERVGGTTTHRAHVRVVCATHRDLQSMVARGEFREDLYYRLCGVTLEVPALRERGGDLPVLARTLLERTENAAGVEPKAIAHDALLALGRHPWPGNVRELENAVRVAALFARGAEIQLSDFTTNVEGLRHLADGGPTTMRNGEADGAFLTSTGAGRRSSSDGLATLATDSGAAADSSDVAYAEIRSGVSLADLKHRLERECIARALTEAGGNITRAAALLGMKRPRLSQLVKQYQLGSVSEEKTS